MIGNVIAELDDFMYVVLGEPEKKLPYGELVGTGECITL
jgi:hypothetical protein